MRMTQACCAVLALLAPASAQTGPAERARLETLAGVWESPAPEPWYGGWGTRRFSFENGRWHLVFTHAEDQAMQRPSFRFRTTGRYSLGAALPALPGTFEAAFGYDAKFVTLLSGEPGWAARFAGCGLQHGVEVDISAGGCGQWRPVAECDVDHDLLAMDASGLRLGVRAADNNQCTPDRRPAALLPPVIRR